MTRAAASVRSLALGVSLAALGGCITTSSIVPTDLSRLDGYQAAAPASSAPRLATLDGKSATLGPRSTLSLQLPDQRLAGRFTAISVRDGVFRGETVDGRTLEADVARVRSADLTEHNVAGTIAWIAVGILVVGASAYVATHLGGSQTVQGRALRIDGRLVLAGPSTREGWRASTPLPATAGLSPLARAALARIWTDHARAEHASVPAFSRLSLTLMALGAPARLVEAAHRAALQEIEHARLTFALASVYANAPVAPAPIVELRGAPAVTAASLTLLAAESLVEGCLLEGVAAAVAAEALPRATDTAVREVLAVIARDERSHAELAWEVVLWCAAAGGPTVTRHIVALAHRLPELASPPDAPQALHGALAAHGWLAPQAWRQVARRTRLDVAARAEHLLAAPADEPARACG